MTKIKTIGRDQFTLKKVKITGKTVSLTATEKRMVEAKPETIEVDMIAKYLPHKDLIEFRDSLKVYLAKAFSITSVFDVADNYLASGKKAKVKERMEEIMDSIEVTGISIGGTDQLRGAVISGKILSWNDSKCAINTPRIVFSSENLGFEQDVEKTIQLIESEVYKYFYEGKSSEASLFNQGDDEEVKDEKKMEVA